MKDRILEFLKNENKSSAQFADEIGVQASSISHIISGRNNPSLDFVMKMLIKYPALSTDWLIFGKGKMYRDQQLNDLFNSSLVDPGITVKVLSEADLNDNLNLKNPSKLTEPNQFNEKKTELNANKIKRIICFYGDKTFKEYLPDEE